MQQRKEEEKKAETLLVKFEEEELHVEEIKMARDKDHEIHRERKNLRTQMKVRLWLYSVLNIHFNTFLSQTTSFMSCIRPKCPFSSHFCLKSSFPPSHR